MSETQSLPGAGSIVQSVGHLIEGFGALQAGKAADKAARADADQREREGMAEANDRARQGRAAVARGAAIAGSSGFTLEGSAMDVLTRMEQEASTAAERARYESYRDADRLRYQGKVAKQQGMFSFVSSTFQAIGSLL